MSGPVEIGDLVRVGRGTSIYRVKKLRDEVDGEGGAYVMATVTTDDGKAGQMVETSRLRKVAAR